MMKCFLGDRNSMLISFSIGFMIILQDNIFSSAMG